MISEKEYWEEMIGIILLVFATYTITKDLIDEKTVATIAFLDNSGVISAIFYAGILDIIIVGGLRLLYNNISKKQG